MKIKDIQTLVVNAEMRNWVFVKIITDQDVYGWGEATVEWKTRAVVGAIEDLKPLIVGKDPRQIKQNYQIMTKHAFWKMGIIGMSAISGIEHAMWDILGKSLDIPVWQLLGGKVRDKVGDDIEIMVDFHGRCGSGRSAIQYVKELEPYKPMFIEEPIQPGDTSTLLQIKESINCP